MKRRISTMIFRIGLVALVCSGCSSMMDPTNAEQRGEKMKRAMDAQKHNGMATAPKNSAPVSP